MEQQNTGYTRLENFRYERKFTADVIDAFHAEQILKLHPAFFSEIFNERYINNVYFDTPRFDFYYDNVEGKNERIKFRVRWYGDLFGKIERPILELKIKKSNVGIKKSYFLNSFEFTEDFNFEILNKIIQNSDDVPQDIKLKMQNLQPVLVNRYSRKYFSDITNEFRITIDKEVSFFDIKSGKFSVFSEVKDLSNIVIELKYDKNLNEQATEIANYLPFRLTKNSKYVTGIEQFNYTID